LVRRSVMAPNMLASQRLRSSSLRTCPHRRIRGWVQVGG
jgi:hypothetical protein